MCLITSLDLFLRLLIARPRPHHQEQLEAAATVTAQRDAAYDKQTAQIRADLAAEKAALGMVS